MPLLLATHNESFLHAIIDIHNKPFLHAIRLSVDGLCRDGPSEISRDPRTKRLQTQPKRLGWL